VLLFIPFKILDYYCNTYTGNNKQKSCKCCQGVKSLFISPQTTDRFIYYFRNHGGNAGSFCSFLWTRVRKLAIDLINEVRNDIGIYKNPIDYHGNRRI